MITKYLVVLITCTLSVVWIAMQAIPSQAQDSTLLEKKVQQLEQRINALEANRSGLRKPSTAGQLKLPANFEKRALLSTRGKSAVRVEATAGAVDTDGDGLTDTEENALGTLVNNADTDGDTLLDGWEVHGVNGIDMYALGASPLHKDIFIEMDFMKRSTASRGLGPSNLVIARIRDAFEQAPVDNPDGVQSINIHLEVGNEVPLDADLNPYRDEFFALKAAHFKPENLWRPAPGSDSGHGGQRRGQTRDSGLNWGLLTRLAGCD